MKKQTTRRKTVIRPTDDVMRQIAQEEIKKSLPVVDKGIAVAIPSTSQEKMMAIAHLCQAIQSLAQALSSTNVDVRVQGCNVTGAVHTGIAIGMDGVRLHDCSVTGNLD